MSEPTPTTATVTPAEAMQLHDDIAAVDCNIQVARNLLDIGEPRRVIREYLTKAQEGAEKASRIIYRIAKRDAPLPTRPANLSDLSALATLDSPEARALLAGLTALLPLAEAMDARRGYTVAEGTPLLPGESRGTDVAEEISTLILRLRTEVHGPQTGRE